MCVYSLSVCFLCVSVAFFFGLVLFRSKLSISAMFLSSIVVFHIVYRSFSISLCVTFNLVGSLSFWRARTHEKKSFDRRNEICWFFVNEVCVCVLNDKLWHIIISLETYKRQRKRRKTNLNHSEFARMFIFLSFLRSPNL